MLSILKTNKDWLVWARKSVHYDKNTVAKKIGVKKETIEKWEDTGEIQYKHLAKLSKIYKQAPFIFFNSNNPVYEKELPDFRTIKNKEITETSKISFELRNAKFKRETLLNLEEENSDFTNPEFKLKNYNYKSKEEIIDFLNNILEMSNTKRSTFNLNNWIRKIENFGILIFQFYNISPKDLRGYAIYYDKLPIIGINHQEKETARKFTLFHELAHLILKKEGLSNIDSYYLKNDTEIKCNSIAAEVLIPSTTIIKELEKKNISNFTDKEIIKNLAKRYNVSNELIVRKFLETKYITQKDYEKYKDELNNYIFPIKKSQKKELISPEDSKKNKLNNDKRLAKKFITENGDYYINSLIYAYKNDMITDLDFARNLDTSSNIVKLLIQRMNGE